MNKNLRILMLTEFFMPFDRGGSEWSAYYLAKSLRKRKVSVEIFTPNYGAKRQGKIDNIAIYRIPFFFKLETKHAIITPFWFTNIFWWFLVFVYLVARVVKFKPTHLHIHGKYFLPPTIIVGKLFRIPIVTTIRDYIVLCPFAYCINKKNHYQSCTLNQVFVNDLPKPISLYTLLSTLHGWAISNLLKLFLKHSDAVVAISQKIALIYKTNQINVDQVIYNTTSFIAIDKKKKLKTQEYILYAGRLTKGKGIDLLVKAYDRLCALHKLPQLLIIGDGPLKKDIERLGSEDIRILGHQTYAKTQNFIKNALFVVMPSKWEEPFGRVALETLSYQVPVLATDRGGLSEIVSHNKTGMIVKPEVKELEIGLREMFKQKHRFRKNIQKKFISLKRKFEQTPVEQHIRLYQRLITP